MKSLSSKIEELHYIAKSTNAAAIGICESKLDALVSEQEISVYNYKILRCDTGSVACYVRKEFKSKYSLCLSP